MNKKNMFNENIQVFVRCRPLLKSEMNFPVPVEVYPELNKIVVRDTGTDKNTVKSFSYDKVFCPEVTQAEIYAEVVAPVVQEVIQGFNCTVFAYGQTGTGKTFTIEGDRSANLDNRSEDPLAGIIPRSMNHLFNEMRQQNIQNEICVSFLELYNEEIFDLQSKTDDLVKLKMFDRSSQKSSVIVQGLQIVPVKSMEEIYTILDKGCKKRRKAATLLNKASSRSHTIFTVTVNIKESCSTIEKLKTAKLNLVDLAGSENIGRSGAIQKRAREAGNINQSLLALGRVITSLCEKAGHIPYRESKLTRLLKDSLGGQTKTAVIATISPSSLQVEETINTLEYAIRAKSITNKPELNAQVTVNSLMQDHLEKITQLRKEIYEMGRTNGFYMTEENFRLWESNLASKREEKFKLLSQIENLNAEDKALDAAILEANNKLLDKRSELENAKARREEIKEELEKEKKEQKLHEEMLKVMNPMYDCLHEEFHKDLEEMSVLDAELSKKNEIVNNAIKEQKYMLQKIEGIRQKRRLWSEIFNRNSIDLMHNMRNMNDIVNSLALECNNYTSELKNGFEARKSDCEDKFENLFQAINTLESINSSFVDNVDASLQEDKSDELNWMEMFYEVYSSSNETTVLEPLNKALNDCESSLLSISSTLNGWIKDLNSEMNIRQKLLKEHADNQNSTLESVVHDVKDLMSRQQDNLDVFNNIVTDSFNSQAIKKKMWSEKFLAVENALFSLDTFCTESIDSEIDKTSQANSSFNNYLVLGNEITEKLTSYCEGCAKNVDDVQKEVDTSVQNVFSEKCDDLKRKVDSSCSKYKDMNAELAKLKNASQKLTGGCTDFEDLLKNKSKATSQPTVAACIETITESVLKCADHYKTLLAGNQIQAEKSALKDKENLEKLSESSKELSNTANSTVQSYIECLETNLIKSVAYNETEIVNNSKNEDSCHGNITADMNETVLLSTDRHVDSARGNECPACSKTIIDETLRTDENISTLFSKDHLKSTTLASGDISASKSLSAFPRSPISRPKRKNVMQARKNLEFPDIEKLTFELLLGNAKDEEGS